MDWAIMSTPKLKKAREQIRKDIDLHYRTIRQAISSDERQRATDKKRLASIDHAEIVSILVARGAYVFNLGS